MNQPLRLRASREVTPHKYDVRSNMITSAGVLCFLVFLVLAIVAIALVDAGGWRQIAAGAVVAGLSLGAAIEAVRMMDEVPSRLGYVIGRLLGQTETTDLYQAMKNRPHATKQGDPHFVLTDVDSDGWARMQLIHAPRYALNRSCHDFVASVIEEERFEPGADPDEVVQAALILAERAEKLERGSHFKALQTEPSDPNLAEEAVQDTLMLMRAAVGNKG